MAFTPFYLTAETNSSDMNAGTTSADAGGAGAASVTSTNGSWDITADTFIATGATPFSGTSVGDWVSIYNDGVTSGAVYVAQVTALYLSGLGVTLSTTAKYGTKPASGGTGKSAKVGGAWASLAVVTSLFASVAVPASTRVNVKAGTYSSTSTSRTFGSPGTTIAPLWWRGYNTTPGDIDANNALTKPVFDFGSGARAVVSGVHQTFTGITFQATISGFPTVACSATSARFHRCRFTATAANASSNAFSVTNNGSVLVECYLSANAAANVVSASGCGITMTGCSTRAGLNGMLLGNVSSIQKCVIDSPAQNGISSAVNGVLLTIDGCSIYNTGSTYDGIRLTTVPVSGSSITNCVFSTCGGYDINQNTGTNTNLVYRAGNLSHSPTSGHENGFGDSPDFLALTDSSSPFTAASSHDFSLVSSSNGKAAGVPGSFENETYTGHLDVGAVQRVEPAASVQSLIKTSIGTY